MKAYNCILIYVLFAVSAASATIINIPDDYPTIQQGIDVSNEGDTVLVRPGIYFARLETAGRTENIKMVLLK